MKTDTYTLGICDDLNHADLEPSPAALTTHRCDCGQNLLVEGRVIGKEQSETWTPNPQECVRLCEALAAFWGDGVCDAPIHPGAYLTEEDTPIRDLIRAAVGWRKPNPFDVDALRAKLAPKEPPTCQH